MSAYVPSVPRTAELRGPDRLLVVVGSALTELGRRRAAARARELDAARRRTVAERDVRAARDARLERRRDNAAQVHPLLLR